MLCICSAHALCTCVVCILAIANVCSTFFCTCKISVARRSRAPSGTSDPRLRRVRGTILEGEEAKRRDEGYEKRREGKGQEEEDKNTY